MILIAYFEKIFFRGLEKQSIISKQGTDIEHVHIVHEVYYY